MPAKRLRWTCAWLTLWLTLAACPPAAGSIVVVRGTSSTPNTAERNYARGVSRRVAGWLAELGLAPRTVDDEALTATLLRGVNVVMLPYNPHPPASEVAVLESFVGRGGRLIVCYAADPRLARLMGVKLGAYRADPAARSWRRIRFEDQAPPGMPALVFQTSRNIRPVYPRRGRGEVIGWWEDSRGKRRDPAWVRTAAGFWMTHVLLDDGDTRSKQRMLIALLGALDPGVWEPAARQALRRAETLGHFENFEAVKRAIRTRGQKVEDTGAADALLGVAVARRQTLRRQLAAREFAAVVADSEALYERLASAYAATFASRPGALHGVWDHGGWGLYPGNWKRTASELADCGITDVFVDVMWPGRARYPSGVVPVDDGVKRFGDAPAAASAALHGHGLRLHVWKICWNLDGAPESMLKTLRKEGRLQRTAEGQTLNWLCPSHPDNLRYEKDALREVLRGYAVDGLHLDYVRYPGPEGCYCDGCRRRFEQAVGRRVSPWPGAARRNALRKRYAAWRCDRITALVRDVGAFARTMKPDLVLSAAVFGKYPSCVDSVGQDWRLWLERGYLDFVVPMNYTEDEVRFRELVGSQRALAASPRQLCPGIGVTAAESRLDVVQVLHQLDVARYHGTRGAVLFDLNKTLAEDILPILRTGPLKPHAAGPLRE